MCPIFLYSKDWKRKRKFRQEKRKREVPVIFWVIKQEKKRKKGKRKNIQFQE
jgi:hypothetical protein